jgi:N-acetylmuramic acid 6-phosphate etherase
VDYIVASFKSGGRLVYVGAGTSGRLGVLDASECPPTFGSDPDMVVGVIAGGYTAVVSAVEGAEDRADHGAQAMDDLEVGPEDTVVGLAASRRTPYVVSAVARARSLGARTVYVTCTPREEFTLDVDVAICPVVGPEVVMGSTRMKAGTAQKLVCNMLSTASFIRIGKVYENMMVDLLANSQKLVERGRRTVMPVTGCDYNAAAHAIEAAGRSVKVAIVMQKLGCSRHEAERRLADADGFVRAALGEAGAGSGGA